MRIQVRLPQVQPHVYDEPTHCPQEGCMGQRFKPHGVKGEVKAVRDPQVHEVLAHRWRCLSCGRTFRVYPHGVGREQQSDRLQALSVLLYILGLSYGGVEDFLVAIGTPVAKTTVYLNVQAAGMAARRQQCRVLLQRKVCPVIGTDGTYVKVKGQAVGVQVVVDDRDSTLLGLEIIVSENIEEVLGLVRTVAEQVQAQVLVSDDLDTYKRVADDLDLDHQICRSHIKRNVDALAEECLEQLKAREPMPTGVDSSPQRLAQDLEQLQELVRARPPDAEERLERWYGRYQQAPQPKVGERHTVWFRMRMLITRLWERWHRLTLDQHRTDLDGTNNSSERMIGWWIKERYRTMRGYKRTESVRNVATLTAHLAVCSADGDMTALYA